jgi:hypothetical protein
MNSKIGYYRDGKRVLPEVTITGKSVKRPVLNTVGLGNKHFVVLDEVMGKKFDLEAALAPLRAEVAALTAPAVEVLPEAEVLPSFGELEADALPVSGTVKRGRGNAG